MTYGIVKVYALVSVNIPAGLHADTQKTEKMMRKHIHTVFGVDSSEARNVFDAWVMANTEKPAGSVSIVQQQEFDFRDRFYMEFVGEKYAL